MGALGGEGSVRGLGGGRITCRSSGRRRPETGRSHDVSSATLRVRILLKATTGACARMSSLPEAAPETFLTATRLALIAGGGKRPPGAHHIPPPAC